MCNRVFKNGGITRRAAEAIFSDQASKQAGAQLPPVNVIEPDTLPQCLEF